MNNKSLDICKMIPSIGTKKDNLVIKVDGILYSVADFSKLEKHVMYYKRCYPSVADFSNINLIFIANDSYEKEYVNKVINHATSKGVIFYFCDFI